MWNRRELLRIGAVSVLAPLTRTAEAAPSSRPAARASGVIFILLQGGPSHHDLWDPKPGAPAEVRGPFGTIPTAFAGVRFGELLPRSAQLLRHLAVVRSMEHGFTNHIAGTYITLTGSTSQPDADREAKAEDFPGPGAILNYLDAAPRPVPVSVSLPNWLSIPGPSNRMPGQYGGVLGAAYDPFLIAGAPERRDFRPLMLSLPDDVPPGRLGARHSLREQLDATRRRLDAPEVTLRERFHATARELLAQPTFRLALDLGREPTRVRERYGQTRIGQSLLLARRLIEAGVRHVAYNEFNQAWDTHGGLQGRYRQIVPPMEQAYSALIEDLADRGLLDRTLVVNTGEFGRTPVVNKDAGRDHWPYAYTTVLAGGGIRGGQIYGSTDSKGAYVASRPVSPADLLATMWTLLGIDPATELRDRVGRPWLVSTGRPVSGLML
ncbi:MAG: DUF1501 domain-containing protein [Gemmataceae bacterium]